MIHHLRKRIFGHSNAIAKAKGILQRYQLAWPFSVLCGTAVAQNRIVLILTEISEGRIGRFAVKISFFGSTKLNARTKISIFSYDINKVRRKQR